MLLILLYCSISASSSCACSTAGVPSKSISEELKSSVSSDMPILTGLTSGEPCLEYVVLTKVVSFPIAVPEALCDVISLRFLCRSEASVCSLIPVLNETGVLSGGITVSIVRICETFLLLDVEVTCSSLLKCLTDFRTGLNGFWGFPITRGSTRVSVATVVGSVGRYGGGIDPDILLLGKHCRTEVDIDAEGILPTPMYTSGVSPLEMQV